FGVGASDPFLATYALPVIGGVPTAGRPALPATRPGGRVALADLALPTGGWSALAPLARLACFTGGVDLRRHPWQWVARDTEAVEHRALRAGHIRIAAGTVRAQSLLAKDAVR
ncbi:MAG: hypothetical protein ACR2F6_00560, partial [Mycobacteriales bacterium]